MVTDNASSNLYPFDPQQGDNEMQYVVRTSILIIKCSLLIPLCTEKSTSWNRTIELQIPLAQGLIATQCRKGCLSSSLVLLKLSRNSQLAIEAMASDSLVSAARHERS